MPPQRVFISSVMRGFEAEREAARAAVASLHLQPVMAEDFGAQPYSPQIACLEGVRSSDVYLGVFGARYGSRTASGKSATAEEFDEALVRGIPILCFVQSGEKEPEQAAFLDRVKQYETGLLVARFTTPAELTLGVVQGLNDLLGRPGVAAISPAAASDLFDRYRWGVLPDPREAPRHHTWLGAVAVPERQGEPYLSTLEFGQKPFRDHLLQPALFGATAIFRHARGTQAREEADALVFEQIDPDRNSVLTSLEVHADGALVYGLALGLDQPRDRWMIQMHVIDEDEVERVLGGFVAFANAFVGGLEQSPLIANVFLGVSFFGIENKAFGHYPGVDPTQMTIPEHRLEDPLHIPRSPLRVARATLADPPSLARRVADHIAREFRLASAYYTPPRP
jgi:hypothetical protein